MLDFNLIEIELRKLLPPDYEKVIVFAHVKENYVGGFNAFNLKGESQTRSFDNVERLYKICLLYTSPSPRDATLSRMPSSA